jgi:hypothetical protein
VGGHGGRSEGDRDRSRRAEVESCRSWNRLLGLEDWNLPGLVVDMPVKRIGGVGARVGSMGRCCIFVGDRRRSYCLGCGGHSNQKTEAGGFVLVLVGVVWLRRGLEVVGGLRAHRDERELARPFVSISTKVLECLSLCCSVTCSGSACLFGSY